jgi:hypothetical protein
MYKLELDWKEHNINLGMIDAQLRLDHPEYCGNQAHNKLELWFTAKPDDSALDQIRAYWESLDEDSAEAEAYKSASQLKSEESARQEALRSIKLGMLEKTWANMNAIERKLYLGLDSEVSHADLVAAGLI